MANAHRSPVRRGPPAPCRPRPPPEPAPPAQGATGGWLCLHDLSSVTTWHRSGIPAQRLWSCPRPVWDPGAVGLAAAHTASQAVAHCSHPAGQGPCPEPQGVDPPRPPLPLFPNLCWLPKLPQSTARDHCQPGGGGLLLQLLSQAGIPGWGPRDCRPARELTGERQVSAPGTPPGRQRRPARPGAPSEEEQPALGAGMWPCTATPWTARVDAGASSESHRRCRWPRAPGSWERPSRHRAQSGHGRASPIPPLCPPRRAGGRPCGLLERAPRLAVAGRDGAAATRPLRGLASPGDGFFRPPRPADFSFKYT